MKKKHTRDITYCIQCLSPNFFPSASPVRCREPEQNDHPQLLLIRAVGDGE